MPDSSLKRTPLFRAITISAAGLGCFVLCFWVLTAVLGGSGKISSLSGDAIAIMIALLGALAASVAAVSFFAGIDESVEYVMRETQVDKLTSLHARTAMIGRLENAALEALSTGRPCFLIDIDIDRFKQINEAIGYHTGDRLIRAFARRLRQCFPRNVQIGRLGAGEFGVLLHDHDGLTDIDKLLATLIEKMSAPYALGTHSQSVNISVGVVAIPKEGTDPIRLLRRSNLALQHARGNGINGWAAYHPDMGLVADHRQWIEAELATAFERGDFRLYYQPQHDLAHDRIVGYEALLRWHHPERGLIPPMDFIPIAEETGMIAVLGEWVLQTACKDAFRLPDDCFVAVNISPVQFMNRDFVSMVAETLDQTGLPARRLEIEITETAMMQDRERAAAIIKEIVAMGVTVAVDDFGTGYSNLSYLIDFSFQKLKIDRSFVSRLELDANSGAVVSTIVGLSRALGVDTIAEGVESERQAIMLRAAGCNVVQGYLYGRPEPLPDVRPARLGTPLRLVS